MGRPRSSLHILLPADSLLLRGSGVDIEPATLHGALVLTLPRAAAFKQITMQFCGTSCVPDDASSSSPKTHIFFTHDWSFLHCGRKHTPTLKAGRHVFPFQLQLDGSLPSSLSSPCCLATIAYHLRATAVRPFFSPNLHASASVRLIRSFASEALEYQQTLDIENTWPGKLMYSLMLPHKAWAAGDTITTLVKFSPLLKGLRIASIVATVHEQLKTFPIAGTPHEESRTIATATHEFRANRAYTLQLPDPAQSSPLPSHIPGPRPHAPPAPPLHSSLLASVPATNTSTPLETNSPEFPELGDSEVVATLPLTLPLHATPSHTIPPIVVSHRIRWRILLTNPDGHTSELRCTLPLHVLDPALLPDARRATAPTRRLLFGSAAVAAHEPYPPPPAEPPSYPAHVLDRAYSPPTRPDSPTDALTWVDAALLHATTITTPPGSARTSRAPSPERGARGHYSLFSLKPFAKAFQHRHVERAGSGGCGAGRSGTVSPLPPIEPVPEYALGLPSYEQAERFLSEGGLAATVR